MSSDWSDLYNTDVYLLTTVEARGSIGSPVVNSVRSAAIRGMLQNVSGSESIGPTGENTEETFDLFIDFGPSVQPADVVEIEGIRYDIVSVSNEGGHNEVLKLGLRKMK